MSARYHFGIWLVLALSLGVVLVGCNGEEPQQPTEEPLVATEEAEQRSTEEPSVEPGAEETELATRTLVILSVEGTVQVRSGEGGELVPAVAGQELVVGDELITGADGEAVLMMDDGTVLVITEEASFVVESLEGTPENPVTRFFLNLGQVFTFRLDTLPADASYEIETPNGVAAIRGSMLSVSYDPVTGQVVATCQTGHCSLAAGGVVVELTAGEGVAIEGLGLPPGAVFVMDNEALQAWIDALQTANNGGANLDVQISLLPVVTPEVTEVVTEVPTVCGDGICNTATENSDLCEADCPCIDDGVCGPGEGIGCRDCIGPGEEAVSGCGSPCPGGSCEGELTCSDGICWDACICGGDCGEPEPQVTCSCAYGLGPYMLCSDGTQVFNLGCNGCYCDEGGMICCNDIQCIDDPIGICIQPL